MRRFIPSTWNIVSDSVATLAIRTGATRRPSFFARSGNESPSQAISLYSESITRMLAGRDAPMADALADVVADMA
jgi:hypothetical protein